MQFIQASAGSDAHSLLGVPPGSPKDVIKRAYRKLVLRTHPDIAQDGGSEDRFIQIQEAYESLIKRRGQPKDAEPPSNDSWDFHDWHWRFRMSRAWAAQQHKPGETNPYMSSERLEPAHRQQVHSQLGALRRKAAYRAAKRAASAAAAAPAVECDSPQHGEAFYRQPVSAPMPDEEAAAGAVAGTRGRADTAAEQQHTTGTHRHWTAQQPTADAASHTASQPGSTGARPQPAHAADADVEWHALHSRHHDAASETVQPSANLQPQATSAAWLDDVWNEQQSGFHETDGAAGTAMREQQDWLLHSGYNSDWWDLEEDEPPAEEHLALLAQLLGDTTNGGTSSGSDAESDNSHTSVGAGVAAGSSQAKSVWLQWRNAAAESGEESSGEGDAQTESGEAAGSEGELSYAASERVRTQLAGLRRKSRLR